MTLWIVLTLMIVVAACGLTIPLVRRYDQSRERGTTLDVLKGQLSEVESQRAGGSISESEAEGLRGEIKRRLLGETRGPQGMPRPLPLRIMPGLALGLVAIVALAATGLYATIGRPDAPVSAPPGSSAQAAADPQHPMGDVTSMIAGLENKLAQAPNDPEGWQMLGWSYMRTGRPADAAKAYARAVALDPKNNEYLSAEGEAMAQADGQVSPDAAAIFRRAQAADPADPRARYFLAMFKDQQGDHKGAMADWIALLKSAPADAPWAGQVRSLVENKAREQGLDISARLPPAPKPASPPAASPTAMPGGAPGPTEAQIAAAGQMPQSDQRAMIQGMVDKLAAQLKARPQDSDGWIRLMRARMVLGQKDQAAAAYRDARKAFANAPSEQAALRDAAQSLSIPN
jgi:cytochrome c-type biogenesis protein CcmH